MTEQQFMATVSWFWARLAGGHKQSYRPDVEYEDAWPEDDGPELDVDPLGWVP